MPEDIKYTKIELIKMARELVINEYLDRRSQDHNKWVSDAEQVWKTQGKRLAYPSFPIYPSELDIIKKAKSLQEFLQDQDSLEDTLSSQTPEATPCPQVQTQEPQPQTQDAPVLDTAAVEANSTAVEESPKINTNPTPAEFEMAMALRRSEEATQAAEEKRKSLFEQLKNTWKSI